jgi:type I restriction enzyme, R subunit
MNPLTFNESETRYNLIDPMLIKAGWNLSDRTSVSFEVPVEGYDASPQSGVTDYCLFRTNGEVLAVIEAKKTKRDARVGKEQVLQYVSKIEKRQSFRPFAMMANGEDIFFWDSETHPERIVAGFFTRENLERLLFLKQNQLPLSTIEIKQSIVNRSYQAEAIRRIGETIEKKKKRKALLVMATGTGKTRTTMALIDVFLKARQAQRILFLADRDSLVDQALTDGFKVHLPNESRERIRTSMFADEKEKMKIKGARILVSTLQTLELCYDKFSPADFDLIVADECHRSIYNKYTDVLAYFDAVQVGLTATPANFLDRDTFRFFECDVSAPTFLYTYDTAVKEKYLADYNVYSAQTKFQRKGIKGIELSEDEQNALREKGINPEDLNFEGTDIEKKVTNRDTLVKQLEEFMDVCHKDARGLPSKTIIFGITQKHALRLEEVFNSMYPEHKGLLCRVITSGVERAKDLLDQFKKQDMPRIAISVDMLDTGVDVPEVMNLAFMKPVGSKIKFWQMIGRGTRSYEACKHFDWLPQEINDEKEKKYFLIVDFWENFEHFNMMPKDDEGLRQVPVLVTIFNTRLKKIETLLSVPAVDLFTKDLKEAQEEKHKSIERIISDLRQMISRIPMDSFTVKKELKNVREAWEDNFWQYIEAKKIEFLRLRVAPLLRFVPDVNMAEAFFTSKMERYGLMMLEKKDLATIRESIRSDVSLLQTHLPQVKHAEPLKEKIIGSEWWEKANLKTIDDARNTLAPLMKYKREVSNEPLELDLQDLIDSRKWVVVRSSGQKMMIEEYKKKVEEKIEQLASTHPTIQRLKKGEGVTMSDLIALEQTLEAELGTDEISLNEDNMLKAFGVRVGSLTDFLKYVLKLEHFPSYDEIVRKAFDSFILEHHYSADQTRFLRTVQSVFLQRRKLEEADLYESPFTNFGINAVEKLFVDKDIEELMELTKRLVA